MSGFTKKVTEILIARDESRCQRCGIRTPLMSRQHRKPRGMGGAAGAHVNCAANGILMCGDGVRGCHGFAESNRTWALGEGWLLLQSGVPEQIPVRTFSGWRSLHHDGTYTALDVPSSGDWSPPGWLGARIAVESLDAPKIAELLHYGR